MTTFETRYNEVTNKDEVHFTSKLISVAETAQTNKNGTNFYPCTVQFTNAKNETVNRSAMIYENNLNKGMEVGQSYNTIKSDGDDGRVYLRMTHLQTSSYATADDFGVVNTEVSAPAVKAVAEFN